MNNTKNGNIMVAILLAIVTFCALAACDNDNNFATDRVTNTCDIASVANNIEHYTIVISDSPAAYEQAAAKKLQQMIKRLTGNELNIVSETELSDLPDCYEILVGMTHRQASESATELLTKKDYLVRTEGNKLILAGNSQGSLDAAIDCFFERYLGYAVVDSAASGESSEAGNKYKEAHSVVAYGANGKDSKDDTEAFKAAVEAAEWDGLPIYVPMGTYYVSETINLNSVTMFGYESGAWPADVCNMPVIWHSNMMKPLFSVSQGSISGLRIMCDYQMGRSIAETIKICGAGSRVTDMQIVNPYIGIKCDDKSNNGRCYIGNVFICQANELGVYVASTYDVPLIENVEVWNPGETCPVAFKFGHNDDIRAVNLFTFNANVGILVKKSEAGSCWGSFVNCSVDYTAHGFKVEEGDHRLTVTGGTWATHYNSILVEQSSNATMTVTGAELASNGDVPLEIRGGRITTVTGCNIIKNFKDEKAGVRITGGEMINISGNTLYVRNDGVNISAKDATVCVNANVIVCGGEPFVGVSKDCVISKENNAIKSHAAFPEA